MRRKSFLAAVAGIAVPVGLQSMLQSSFSMVDQLMVGQLGSAAVAAVEAASRPAFIFSVVTGAVAAIAGIMISQYLGMKEDELADRSLSVNLAAVLALAALFTAACLVFPEQMVRVFVKDDPEIIALGRGYLLRIAWTCLPMGAASILSVMIRCAGRPAYPLFAGILSAVVNTALNYALIFGHLGLPALGVAGAAIASVISQLVNLLLIASMFYQVRMRGRVFRPSFSLGREGWRQFAVMLFPILVNEFLWSAGQSLNTCIYGHIGTGALAAMSLTGPVQGLFIGALGGVSQAAGILIGKRLGAGEYEEAYRESKKLIWYGVIGSLALSALLVWLRRPYVRLYKVEEEVRADAAMLLLAFAVLAPVKVSNMILGGGIIRSGGKTAYIMSIDMAGTWLLGAPLGLAAAFVFHLPIVWVYFILSQEEAVRLLLSVFIFRRRNWMSSLSKS